jgi:hypothetical protein
MRVRRAEVKMTEQEYVFSEAEWNKEVPKITRAMHEYAADFWVPISKHFGEYGEAWGTGTYLRLAERTFILTNEHVARIRGPTKILLHQVRGWEDMHPILGDHAALEWPLDVALLPVTKSIWDAPTHTAKAITPEMIALAHAPVETELLTFAGFSGDRSQFYFNTLYTPGTSSTAREVALPDDDRFDPRFHFAIDYRPDLATSVIGSHGLPRPPGFSGAAVWNTRFVESRLSGYQWTPQQARVTGIVWGWPSSSACIVATRSEYIRSFLFGVPDLYPAVSLNVPKDQGA